MTVSDSVEVEMKYVDLRRGKPPSASLFLDVTLHNRADEQRWFLLPTVISPGTQATGGGISGLEVFEYSGRGRVLLGHFFGNGGFQAILLPANAEVELRRFPIKFWGATPDGPLPVAVTIANRVSIDGQPAETWFDGPALSDKQADVAADQGKRVSARHSPDSKELPVTFEGRRSLTMQVTIH